MRWRLALLGLVAVGIGGGLFLTAPSPLSAADQATLAGFEADATRGEAVYWAAGCASCHTAPDSDDKLTLAGGYAFATEFGTFYAPNISMDPDQGIGGWSLAEFANATQRGVSPDGSHYYPAFPYTSYALMEGQDVADLWAFWQTLPASDVQSKAHEVGFPFNIRRSLGGWKLLNGPVPLSAEDRGTYLVEALSHCGECHTPRDAIGGLDRARWLQGAPNPSGRGTIPALTPDKLTWSESDIASYLKDGFTPDFDSAGGSMVSVIDNLSQLPDADRAAIATYLKALPAAQ
jgi:mono/diheme cytochrome c family protein